VKQDVLAETIKEELNKVHNQMFEKALKARESFTKHVDNWHDFMHALSERNICIAPWCNCQECEVNVKDRSKAESEKAMEEANEGEKLLTGSAKTLCIPFEQPKLDNHVCFACGKKATVFALWGRSY
jgi:prolyl-tRNA synthetase